MRTILDVQQLLKRFGAFIYTGNRMADLELYQSEIQEMYQNGMISNEDYRNAILIIKSEQNKLN
ncbi:YqgQ family protein [Alkalihalobacillus sp. TS-13]|uniref:YqgQ family protein n=1 Tax=Alkalihalobacillus sp. TS-13 TaxID=2842455 RepID=UPI001C879F92|nr:YqgQ family protein [Alkalihalobacillus sp. TS-13]